jgi:pimeloyl-ACP methyl ester carboxylesterase
MIALVLLAALHATPAPTVNSEPYTHAQRLVDIGDGRKLNLYCIGNGSPTVIFDSGLDVGSGTLSWNRVQPAVARFTRACSYDRAGYGFSDPGPLPRTSNAVVSDLRALLDRAGIEPPYILVGHSIAGLYEPLFADRYPPDVVGMVLVERCVKCDDSRDAAYSRRMGRSGLRARQCGRGRSRGRRGCARLWHDAVDRPYIGQRL